MKHEVDTNSGCFVSSERPCQPGILGLKSLTMVATVVKNSVSLSNTALSGFLFDIDGTLVNSDPIHQAVFRELLVEEGFNDKKPIDEGFFREHIAGRQNAMIMADLFPEWPIPKREEWSVKKEARFREVAASSMLERKMPGLDKLRKWIVDNKLPRAAVTNAPRLNAEAMLGGIAYETFFHTLIIGDECTAPKPQPDPYLKACKNLGVGSSQCIVFEDSPSGVRAGVAAGAFVIGILSGQEEETLLEAGCSLVINDFEDRKLWAHLESRS
jgi:HAD superfamily hydrolase (TIGR01509 family)